jgi:AcrR family transcriptional regulator
VPTLWDTTIDAHRRAVREATLDATGALVAERGLAAVTMSEIAGRTGIGRATLYKYFPDVDAVVAAWHERVVARHVEALADAAAGAGQPLERLERVLGSYARLARHDGSDPARSLHGAPHARRAEQHLVELVAGLIDEAAHAGEVRDDVVPGELAVFCLHAVAAAGSVTSTAAARRIVAVTLDGLRRPQGNAEASIKRAR